MLHRDSSGSLLEMQQLCANSKIFCMPAVYLGFETAILQGSCLQWGFTTGQLRWQYQAAGDHITVLLVHSHLAAATTPSESLPDKQKINSPMSTTIFAAWPPTSSLLALGRPI